MYKKLKSYLANDTIFMAGLLLGVGIISFGLGRLSTGAGATVLSGKGAQTQVALVQNAFVPLSSTSTTSSSEVIISTITPAVPSTAPYVGSKSGTKYHLTNCPSAKRIKPENKIYFRTTAEAESAGYTKAANCPGL